MTKISSMTGYANLEAATEFGTLVCECRSVNSKFLDITLKLDESIRFMEPTIREMIQKNLGRGKVEVRLFFKANESSLSNSTINKEALGHLIKLQNEVLEACPKAHALSVQAILSYPGIVSNPQVSEDALKEIVASSTSALLEKLKEARKREGLALQKVLLGYTNEIESEVLNVKAALPNIIKYIEDKLEERLNEALSRTLTQNSTLTKEEVSERIRQEVTLYAIRLDVDEEMNRLLTHIAEARRLLADGSLIGKRLDFLTQEMNREANTLGSKAAAIDMTQAAMSLKVVIDKFREQIQNIE